LINNYGESVHIHKRYYITHSGSLGIDIADIDTSFMGEQNLIAFTLRVDADIVLGVAGMGQEGLDNKVVQCTSNRLDLNGLSGAFDDPGLALLPALVQAQQPCLASAEQSAVVHLGKTQPTFA
jgi:hypothetical protein